MPYTYRCRRCSHHVSSCLSATRCPSCGKQALRQFESKEYRQMASAPSHILNPNPNYKEEAKGDY
jgi:DNA-directed RNA polymerase subunit RPC12/RpoP